MDKTDNDRSLRKFSEAALVPGNLAWRPVKFRIGCESGYITVEVNSSNRTWMEQNHAAFDEARRVLDLRGFRMITSVERIPLFA